MNRPFEVWRLSTVFMDGAVEKEGDNVDANIRLLVKACRRGDDIIALPPADEFEATYEHLVRNARQPSPTAPLHGDAPLQPVPPPPLALPHIGRAAAVAKSAPTVGEGASARKELVTMPAIKSPKISGTRGTMSVSMDSVSTKVWSRSLLRDITEVADAVKPAKQRGRRQRRDAQFSRCPHCKLTPSDPPFYLVPAGSDKPQPHLGAKQLTYGNLPLGITSSALTDGQLWRAVARLQMPSYARLTVEQCAHACRDHFLSRIGVPPWIESLIAAQRQHKRCADALKNEALDYSERTIELNNEIQRLQKSIDMQRLLSTLTSPEEQRDRLMGQIQIAKLELADKQWQIAEGEHKNRRDQLLTEIQTALVSFRVEEVQRLLLSIGVRCRSLRATKKHELQLASTGDRLQEILSTMPSGEMGKSTRRARLDADDAAAALQRLVQCDDCWLLASYSPFCPSTGLPHSIQTEKIVAYQKQLRDKYDAEARAHRQALEAGSAASDTSHDHTSIHPPASNPLSSFDAVRIANVSGHQAPKTDTTLPGHPTNSGSGSSRHTRSVPKPFEEPLASSLADDSFQHSDEIPVTAHTAENGSHAQKVRAEAKHRPVEPKRTPDSSSKQKDHRQRGSPEGAARSKAFPLASESASTQLHQNADGEAPKAQQGQQHARRRRGAGDVNPSPLASSTKQPHDGGSGSTSEQPTPFTHAFPLHATPPEPDIPLVLTSIWEPTTQHQTSATHAAATQPATISSDSEAKRKAAEIQEALEVFSTFAGQTESFLHAAASGDRRGMHEAVRLLEPGSEASSRYAIPAASLHDVESRFMEWLYGATLEPAPPQMSPLKKVNTDGSRRTPETSTRTLKLQKELRELQHALMKRPNPRNQGLTFDDDVFIALAERKAELMKRIATLTLKAKSQKSTQQHPTAPAMTVNTRVPSTTPPVLESPRSLEGDEAEHTKNPLLSPQLKPKQMVVDFGFSQLVVAPTKPSPTVGAR